MGTLVVHAEDVAPRPWANGGGTTLELLSSDDGTWRVSLARIDQDGPFSSFPGRRRVLTVVDGPVLVLSVDGTEHVVEPRRPFGFAGDATATAAVPEGAVRALNVIVDPGVVSPLVTVLELGRGSSVHLDADQAAFVLQGSAQVGATGAAPDSLVVGPADVGGRATLAIITLVTQGG